MKRFICFIIYCIGVDWLCKKYLNFSPIQKVKEAASNAKNS